MSEKKMGRPPLGEEKRSYVRNVRFTEAEGEEVTSAAEAEGVPVAAFIRDAALDRARQRP